MDIAIIQFTCNSCIFSCNSGDQDEESSVLSESEVDLFLRFPVKETLISTGFTATAAAAAKSDMAAKGATNKARGLIPPTNNNIYFQYHREIEANHS